ncbi:hypothetical protein C7448_10819 [Tenacibaculum gallaicum]|uniref:PH (Pleckstrin Homology) domain-containing protein n=1 Tax=Tenacibaculum gallaicum TaxID=561505 RepID=A0A3E0HIN0_9FLAO|nr:hypothetical protein [Tenacibaculum gallaicum]REH46349.1 hypothetical protein C7448_10819 [Tenacibaculum gallaicum]
MKEKIHFDYIGNINRLTVLSFALLLIVLGFFTFLTTENSKWSSGLLALLNFSLAIYFSKVFWYKNYVRYNKLGMLIKIQSFTGKQINFSELAKVELTENSLIIYKRRIKEPLSFNIASIEKGDVLKLYNLLNQKIKEL